MSIKASLPVVVNDDRNIEQMLRDNGYLTFISAVVLRQIQPAQSGERHIVVDIVQTKTTSSSSGVRWLMNTHLRRPLDVIELLHFGEQYPGLSFSMPIVALGTVIELGNSRHVFGLTVELGEQVLRLFPLEGEWSAKFGFACSRK
jgi:hypothetical protein